MLEFNQIIGMLQGAKDQLKLIKRGIQSVQQLSPFLWVSTALRACFAVALPFFTFYMSSLILDALILKEDADVLIRLIAWTVGTNLLIYVLNRVMALWVTRCHIQVNYWLDLVINEKIVNLDYAAIEDPATHVLKTKIDEFNNMNGGALNKLADGIYSLMVSLLSMITAILLMPKLFSSDAGASSTSGLLAAGLFVGILVVCMLANSRFQMIVQRYIYSQFSSIMDANRVYGFYVDHVSNYNAGKGVRVYHQQRLLLSCFQSFIFKMLMTKIDNMARTHGKFTAFSALSTSLSTCVVYLFVAFKALTGTISAGSIILYIGAIGQFTQAAQQCLTAVFELKANNQYLADHFSFLDLESKMHSGTLPVEKRNDDAFEIAFHKVSFKYPGSEIYVLKDVSLELNIGERLAIVGMNGSGKTTLINLLCRLYDPTEGTITLNGIDIRKYDYQEYLALFSVVFQDFKLFAFSLGQNVATQMAYDGKAVTGILEQVGLGDRVSKMAQGLETYLYKHFDVSGEEISGGEGQKVALARAVYRDAPIVILDEPTSALDPIAEYEIYTKFNDIVRTKTAFYISHRLSSCRFCDRIAVFHEGKLVEHGHHDTLVAKVGSQYHQLWHAQASYYTG